MLTNLKEKNDRPDEELSYTELRDRIRNEVANALPKKERIMVLAKKREDNFTIKDTICGQICIDFKGVITGQYIRRCLPDEYKQQRKKRVKSSSHLRNNGLPNEGMNALEQRAIDGCDIKKYTQAGMRREITQLRAENERLRKKARSIEELKKQLAEQVSELTKENENLKNLLEEKKDVQQQKIVSDAQGKKKKPS
jgi:uncharacterized coiled-coil protein SlyX